MAIYIKGMEMPKGCDKCLLGDIVCKYDEDHIDLVCPLIEVPEPHGRLIDADKAVRDYHEYGISHMYDAADLADIMDDSPTVIEGSE